MTWMWRTSEGFSDSEPRYDTVARPHTACDGAFKQTCAILSVSITGKHMCLVRAVFLRRLDCIVDTPVVVSCSLHACAR